MDQPQPPPIRRGFKFVYQLPPGWDERTKIVGVPNARGILAVHPDHAPIYIDAKEIECKCDCHKPEPEGWTADRCCPDCGSTLWGGYNGD